MLILNILSMDEQSRLNGAKKEGVKETILDNLVELGDVPQILIDIIKKQDNMDILKSWNKIAARAESIEEFQQKIEI